MRASRRRRVLMGAAAAVPTALAVAPTTTAAASIAAPPPADEPSPSFCSTVMLTSAQLDAGVRSTVLCYDTYEESVPAAALDPAGTLRTASSDAATNGLVVIADHYEETWGGGVPLTIWGYAGTCDGGGVSFEAGHAWNDRIRNTAPRACSRVKHFSDAGFSGITETIVKNSDQRLLSMPGAVSSMRYYS